MSVEHEWNEEHSADLLALHRERARLVRANERRRAGIAYDMAMERQYPHLGAWHAGESPQESDQAQDHGELMATMNRLIATLAAGASVAAPSRAGSDQYAAPQQDRPAPTPTRSTPPLARVYELRKALGIYDNTDLRGMDDDAMRALLEHLEGEVALRASAQ
jgi:hypothetical protein